MRKISSSNIIEKNNINFTAKSITIITKQFLQIYFFIAVCAPKYPPINIMFEDRGEYYQTLQKYSRDDDLKSTLKFLIKQYKKTLKEVTTKKTK